METLKIACIILMLSLISCNTQDSNNNFSQIKIILEDSKFEISLDSIITLENIILSPDENYAAIQTTENIFIWNLRQKEMVKKIDISSSLDNSYVTKVLFSPDSKYFSMLKNDEKIYLYLIKDFNEKIYKSSGAIFNFIFNSNANYIIAAGTKFKFLSMAELSYADGELNFWNINNDFKKTINFRGYKTDGLKLNESGTQLITWGEKLHIIDLEDLSIQNTIIDEDDIYSCDFGNQNEIYYGTRARRASNGKLVKCAFDYTDGKFKKEIVWQENNYWYEKVTSLGMFDGIATYKHFMGSTDSSDQIEIYNPQRKVLYSGELKFNLDDSLIITKENNNYIVKSFKYFVKSKLLEL